MRMPLATSSEPASTFGQKTSACMPSSRDRLERLVDLVEAVAVLGRDRVLHDEQERLLRVDRRARAAELLEHVAAQARARCARRGRSTGSRR